MIKIWKSICLMVVLALVLSLGAALLPFGGHVQAAGGTYYVDASVGGPGSGTSGDPWKTITLALATVSGGDSSNPDVINVAAGTYDAANGETFPLTFSNDGVSLVGADATTTTIDGGSAGTILDIDADGITIQDFTITNSTSDATYGIEADVGGFSVLDNTFTNVDYGVYLDIDEYGSNLTVDYTINDLSISGNTLTINDYGVYVYIWLDFDATVVTGLSATIGDIDILNNVFNMGTNYAVYISEIWVEDLNSGTVSVGDVDISDNEMYDGSEGIDFYGGFSDLTDTTVTVGDITMNDNTVEDQTSYGIYLYYYSAEYWYGTTSGTFGDLFIDGNTVDVSGYGIYLYYDDFGYDMEDSATLTAGDVHIEDNVIDADDEAIYIYFYDVAYEMDDDSDFSMGDINIVDNDISGTDDGIYIEYDDYEVGSYMVGNSSARLADYIITGNTINVEDYGIYFYTYSNPDDNEEYATLDFGGFLIDDNIFNDEDVGMDYGIYLEYDDFGEDIDDDTVTTIGDVTITNNNIYDVEDDGMYILYGELGYDLEESAALIVGDLEITDNMIDGAGNGIKVEYDEGADTYDDSSVTVGIVDISRNTISNASDQAIELEYDMDFSVEDDSTQDFGNVTIADNVIDVAYEGILVLYDIDVDGGSGETVTMGTLDITGNEVSEITGDDGIDVEYDLYVNDDTLNIGRALIQGNTVTDGASAGIDVDMYIETSDGTVNLGDLVIDENTLEDNRDGISFQGVKDATVTENTIRNNTGGAGSGIHLEDWEGHESTGNVFRCNNIEGNEPYGLDNDGTGEVDAEGNWWGDASGPSGKGPGSGDAVSSNVDYNPWLTTPCEEEEIPPPVATFSISVNTGEAPLHVQFRDASTGDIEERLWSFGGGGSSTGINPSHIFQNEGNFTVSLTVTGPGGEDTAYGEIMVESMAVTARLSVRNLYITPTSAQPRQAVGITAQVVNEGGTWGSQTLNLLINGYLEQSVGVGVAPGTSQPINFTVYKVQAGEYQVTIGDATGTFFVMGEVEPPKPPQPGLLVGGELDQGGIIAIIVIGIILVSGIVLAVLFTRRA